MTTANKQADALEERVRKLAQNPPKIDLYSDKPQPPMFPAVYWPKEWLIEALTEAEYRGEDEIGPLFIRDLRRELWLGEKESLDHVMDKVRFFKRLTYLCLVLWTVLVWVVVFGNIIPRITTEDPKLWHSYELKEIYGKSYYLVGWSCETPPSFDVRSYSLGRFIEIYPECQLYSNSVNQDHEVVPYYLGNFSRIDSNLFWQHSITLYIEWNPR